MTGFQVAIRSSYRIQLQGAPHMKTPFFSIIIPTLNEEKFIGRLLNNLSRQTESDFEVLVVDNQSEDKTQSIVQKYAAKLPLKLLVGRERNVSRQRNLGAAKSRGTYLVFFDADVQIPAQFLKLVHLEIDKYDPSHLTTLTRADTRDFYDETITNFTNLGTQLALIIDKPFVPGFNFIIKRKVFSKIGGFRKDVVHGEDFDLAIRLHEAGFNLMIIKKPRLIYSLRRFREEGRLKVIQKNATSAIHQLTKGSITKEIFEYPMGGGWYKKEHILKKNEKKTIEDYLIQIKHFFLEI